MNEGNFLRLLIKLKFIHGCDSIYTVKKIPDKFLPVNLNL